MANPRQRRKSRSSTHKAVSHSRHAKRNLKKTPPIRAPKVLQDAWDNRKTVQQNYAALGLIHDLNPSAPGGHEQPDKSHAPSTSITKGSESTIPAVIDSQSAIPSGYAKLVRDESGNVVGIEWADSEDEDHAEKHSDRITEMSEPEVDESLLTKWAVELGGEPHTKWEISAHGKSVVNALEQISSTIHSSTTLSPALSGVGPRHASAGEIVYLERLVKKYGQDVEGMAKDRKLNMDQRTVGELRRALRRAGFNAENFG